jgi:L,D-peptidoglycan transpeptidase YkuD (ErfK/YbiS/YcfS/YnhG family)
LPSTFGRQANPGSGLSYRRVGTSDWWVSDVRSPAYNTYQWCVPGTCRFNEAAGENLGRAGKVYDYAVVMGVNAARRPGGGSAFFLHVTNGSATAGCVAIAAASLIALMRWLRPGTVIALARS